MNTARLVSDSDRDRLRRLGWSDATIAKSFAVDSAGRYLHPALAERRLALLSIKSS